MKQYNTVFIDLDDTLIDTSGSSLETIKTIYDNYHFESYFESYDQFLNTYFENNVLLWEQFAEGSVTKEQINRGRLVMFFKNAGNSHKNKSK